MRKTLIASCAILATLSIGACKKKGTDKSRTELITANGWVVTSIEQRAGTSGSWTVSPNWTNAPGCERDDVTLLRTDMSYEMNEGASKCDPSDPQVFDTGSWSWQDGENKVNMDGQVFDVETLNESTLVVNTLIDLGGGAQIGYRVSYRH